MSSIGPHQPPPAPSLGATVAHTHQPPAYIKGGGCWCAGGACVASAPGEKGAGEKATRNFPRKGWAQRIRETSQPINLIGQRRGGRGKATGRPPAAFFQGTYNPMTGHCKANKGKGLQELRERTYHRPTIAPTN